jgi:hypothetical protein
MVDEIEFDLDQPAVADMHRRAAEAAGADVERHLPAVVEPGREREPQLADDLRPELQGRAAVAPFGEAKLGPGRAVGLLRAHRRSFLARPIATRP